MSIYSHFKSMRNPLLLAKLFYKSVVLVKHPTRLDEVIELADSLSTDEVMGEFLAFIRRDPTGARALVEHPRVRIVGAELRALPPGTLGREYIDFMDANGLNAEDLPTRPAENAADFVRAHLFETHDIWHVVTGFKTDLAGELGLQAFYLAQLPARLSPLLLAVGMVNTLVYDFDQRDVRMDAIAHGWRLGKQTQQLFGQRWNDLWAVPLAEVQKRLGVTASAASVSNVTVAAAAAA
jgi:ubiquinone biosynthesis protein COQ4